MYSKMTAEADGFDIVATRKRRWPDFEGLKKEARIAEPLSKEQHEELLTMTGPPATA
jgi:hypothetical protein